MNIKVLVHVMSTDGRYSTRIEIDNPVDFNTDDSVHDIKLQICEQMENHVVIRNGREYMVMGVLGITFYWEI